MIGELIDQRRNVAVLAWLPYMTGAEWGALSLGQRAWLKGVC